MRIILSYILGNCARNLRLATITTVAMLAIILPTTAGAADRIRSLASSASFTPPASLSEAGRNAVEPQVAVGADGAVTIVWSRFNGSNYIVQATTRPADSTAFGAPVNLSALGLDAEYPQIATGPDGATTVTWGRINGLNRSVQAATRPAGSATFGAPASLSDAFQNAINQQIAVGADGTTTVTWRRFNGSNFIIQAATRPAGSSTFLGAVNVSEAGQDAFNPQVAVGPDGASTITWHRYNGSNNIIQAATRPADSGTYGDPVNLSAAGQNATNPQIAVSADGATTVTWRRYSGFNFIVQAATRPAASGIFSAPVDVSVTGQSAIDPHVAVGADGAVTIVWYRFNGFNFIIQAATRPAGAPSFAAPVNVSEPGQEAFEPRVAVNDNGTITITWHRDNGSNFIVQAATRPAGSDTYSAPVDLSAAGRNAEFQQIATGPDGATAITWVRNNGSNSIAQASSSAALLSVERAGLGAGSVSSTPAGIDCGATCSALFPLGLRVMLTATPNQGSSFVGWSGGGCLGGAVACGATLTASTSVLATFSTDLMPPDPDVIPPDPDAIPPTSLRLIKTRISNRAITTSMRVSGPGVIKQAGTAPQRKSTTKNRVLNVCKARRTIGKAGIITLTCRLSAKARAARKKQTLRVRLVTTFTSTDGTTKRVSKIVVLKKTRT